MAARYKILLIANCFFLMLFVLGSYVLNIQLKKLVHNSDPVSGLLTVIVFIQFGIYLFLAIVLVVTLVAYGWSRYLGKTEFKAAAKIQMAIILVVVILMMIFSGTYS